MMYIFKDPYDGTEFMANDQLKSAIEAIKNANKRSARYAEYADEYTKDGYAEDAKMLADWSSEYYHKANGMLKMFNMICGTKLTMPNIICGKFQEMC